MSAEVGFRRVDVSYRVLEAWGVPMSLIPILEWLRSIESDLPKDARCAAVRWNENFNRVELTMCSVEWERMDPIPEFNVTVRAMP